MASGNLTNICLLSSLFRGELLLKRINWLSKEFFYKETINILFLNIILLL